MRRGGAILALIAVAALLGGCVYDPSIGAWVPAGYYSYPYYGYGHPYGYRYRYGYPYGYPQPYNPSNN